MSNKPTTIDRLTQALRVAAEHIEWCLGRGMTLAEIADSVGRPIALADLSSVISLLAREWLRIAT